MHIPCAHREIEIAVAKILVVDDESGVCQTVSDILSSDGHACECLYLGQDALQLLNYMPIDLGAA